MATRTQKVKLGVFLTVGFALMVVTLIVLTGMGLWEERATYYIEFGESVSGLEQGAPVKLRGVRVGTVDAIRVDPENVEIVETRIKVDEGTPIKTDTKAYINMQGITGLKFIELASGTAEAPLLPPGGEIEAGQSMLEQLTGRATDIGLKVEKVLNNILYMTRDENQKAVDDIVGNTEASTQNLATLSDELTRTLEATRVIAEENRETISMLITNANETSQRTNQVLAELSTLTGLAEQVIRESDVPRAVSELRQTNAMVQERLRNMNVGGTMDKVSTALDTLSVLIRNINQTLDQNQEQLRVTLYNLRLATESFKELARSLRSEPSRLIFDDKPEERDLP